MFKDAVDYPTDSLSGSNVIIFVYSRHVETVILMTRCGKTDK